MNGRRIKKNFTNVHVINVYICTSLFTWYNLVNICIYNYIWYCKNEIYKFDKEECAIRY